MSVPSISHIRHAKLGTIKPPAFRLLALFIGLVVFTSTVLLTGCVSTKPEVEDEIRAKVVSSLTATKETTLRELEVAISKLDQEISALNLKLDKLNQVAAPAQEWVQVQKADAEKKGYGGTRIVESMGYLESDAFKNDQFRVVKLQFTSEMLSAGIKYTSVIRIEDLMTGKIGLLEEFRSELEDSISALTFNLNAKKKTFNLVASTADNVLNQSQNWKVIKVNPTTYNVSGLGLGMEGDLTNGVWTYYLEPERFVPSDAASNALLKVLGGKQ